MRLSRSLLPLVALLVTAPFARADYIVLRSGQRLNVTSYQLLGQTYRLQLPGGVAEIPVSEVVGIEPQEIFTPPTPQALSAAPAYAELIRSAATRHGVDADLIVSVIFAESNFNPHAVSRKNARGLMQLLPETARRLGVRDVFDPKENIEAGTRYLRELLVRYHNDLLLALAAYNAGPERVREYGQVPPYAETLKYVRRIQGEYASRKSAQGRPLSYQGGSF